MIDYAGRTDEAFGLAAQMIDYAGRTDEAFGLAALGGCLHVGAAFAGWGVSPGRAAYPPHVGEFEQERFAVAEELNLHALAHQRGALKGGAGAGRRNIRKGRDERGPLGLEGRHLVEAALADELELALDAPGERLIRRR
jgi:hypothetical protein